MPESAAQELPEFEFEPTAAVSVARAHKRFVHCPACRADNARYLFHRTGVRFVQCGACGMVYVNPAREQGGVNYFDMDGTGQMVDERERDLRLRDFGQLLHKLALDYEHASHTPLTRTLLLGRFSREFRSVAEARRVGLDIAEIDDQRFARLATGLDLDWAKPALRAPAASRDSA